MSGEEEKAFNVQESRSRRFSLYPNLIGFSLAITSFFASIVCVLYCPQPTKSAPEPKPMIEFMAQLFFKAIALSPDGKTLFLPGDESINVWDITAHQLKKKVELAQLDPGGTQYRAASLAINKKGNELAILSCCKTDVKATNAQMRAWRYSIIVVALPEFKRLFTLPGASYDQKKFCFSPDGTKLASSANGYDPGQIGGRLRGNKSAGALWNMKEHFDSVLAISPHLWDQNGRLVQILKPVDNIPENPIQRQYLGYVCGLAFSPDGKILASANGDLVGPGDVDWQIRLWEAASGTYLRTLLQEDRWRARVIAFSPDGTSIAGGTYNGQVRIWNVHNGALLKTLNKGPDHKIDTLCFSPDGRLLATAGNGIATLWDIDSGAALKIIADECTETVLIDPEGKTLWINGRDSAKGYDIKSILAASHHLPLNMMDKQSLMNELEDRLRIIAKAGVSPTIGHVLNDARTCPTTVKDAVSYWEKRKEGHLSLIALAGDGAKAPYILWWWCADANQGAYEFYDSAGNFLCGGVHSPEEHSWMDTGKPKSSRIEDFKTWRENFDKKTQN